MAKLLGPAFRRGVAIASTLVALAGTRRASLRVVESIAFIPAAANPIYLGAAGRSTRYLGTRTDLQIYLGVNALF